MLQSLIPEVMDVLNEWLNLLDDVALPGSTICAFDSRHFVSRKRLGQYLDQGTVARQEYRMGRILFSATTSCDIQTDQSLTGAWDSRDKNYGLLA